MAKGYIIGLTGKTGAGKTSVGALLEEYGCVVIDCDKLARDVTNKGSPILMNLASFFGQDIIDNQGNLDRKILAKKAFSSRDNVKKLNEITHPEILRQSFELADKVLSEGANAAILDAAALFESNAHKKCDFNIVVTAPEKIRLKRIMERDRLNEIEARHRIKAQRDDDYYISRADYVVNAYEPFNLEEQLKEVIDRIRRGANA